MEKEAVATEAVDPVAEALVGAVLEVLQTQLVFQEQQEQPTLEEVAVELRQDQVVEVQVDLVVQD